MNNNQQQPRVSFTPGRDLNKSTRRRARRYSYGAPPTMGRTNLSTVRNPAPVLVNARNERSLLAQLNEKLNKNQRAFAEHIIRGHLDIITSTKIPKSYYDTAFDTHGNKLGAFAAKVAVTMKNAFPYLDIFKAIVNQAESKAKMFTCAKGARSHCLPHAIANRATTAGHINTIRNIVGKNNFNKHAAKPNHTGKRAANYSTIQSVKNSLVLQQVQTLPASQQNQLSQMLKQLMR